MALKKYRVTKIWYDDEEIIEANSEDAGASTRTNMEDNNMTKHWSGNGLHFAVGKKVFETEKEAINWCKDLMKRGIVQCYRETMNKATHRYIGDGIIETL